MVTGIVVHDQRNARHEKIYQSTAIFMEFVAKLATGEWLQVLAIKVVS